MSLCGCNSGRRLPMSLRGRKSQSPSEPFGDAENFWFCLQYNSDIQSSCAALTETGTKRT